jgi:hypothetical protein
MFVTLTIKDYIYNIFNYLMNWLMKKLLFFSVLLLALFSSCSQEDETNVSEVQTDTSANVALLNALSNFEQCLNLHQKEFKYFAENYDKLATPRPTRAFEVVPRAMEDGVDLSSIMIASDDVLHTLAFTESELMEISGDYRLISVDQLNDVAKVNIALHTV